MLYFKKLKDSPAEGSDLWTYEKLDPNLFTLEGLLRDVKLADGYAEVSEEEYLREVAEGTEGRSTEQAQPEQVANGSEADQNNEEEVRSPEDGGEPKTE